jgi:hypothetical protein
MNALKLILILGTLTLAGCWHSPWWFDRDDRGSGYSEERHEGEYNRHHDYRDSQKHEERREEREHGDRD